jgi:hypothetical protein
MLEYRSIDMMQLSKDLLDSPASSTHTDNHIEALCRDYPTLTHIGISVPMNTNAQAMAARGSNFGIEPATYAAQFIDKIHAMGKKVLFRGTDCAFEGIYSFAKTDKVNGTLANYESTPDSWLARCATWIEDNIAMFDDGDLIAPFPEASSHWPLTNGGNYNQFFMDLSTVLQEIGTDNSKAIDAIHFSHIWTSAIQNAYNTQYTEFGVATYDHYGTAVGNGYLSFDYYPSTDQVTNWSDLSGSDTYSLTSSINEGATHKRAMTPEKASYNKRIEVYVVSKGTGDWTMTIHDGSNNPVQMPDHTDFDSKSNSYQATILNANLTEGAWNSFDIDWDNPSPDTAFHFHLTSSDGTGTVKVASGHGSDMAWIKSKHWKANAIADALEIDIRKTYSRTGVPQFLQEWGDYWSTDSGRSNPVRDQTEHEAYLDDIYAALSRLVADGILIGFQYWRSGGGHEGLMYDADEGAGYDYQMNYAGEKLQAFFAQYGNPYIGIPRPFIASRPGE